MHWVVEFTFVVDGLRMVWMSDGSGRCNREGGHGSQEDRRFDHQLLEGSEGVRHRAVVHISSLLGGSECAGFNCDVGDGCVGGVTDAFEVVGDAVWSEGVIAVEPDGVCWC